MDNGWVFVSHSHKDIERVRLLRNRLEELGLSPLLFFLKCLQDGDEITDLIKREIDARDWFIYADSPNARNSTWVQTERDYIENQSGKKIFAIDLMSDFSQLAEDILHISRQMKVFISYSHRDAVLADALYSRFAARDMHIMRDADMHAQNMYSHAAGNMITNSCHDGFVLLLISENTHDNYAIQDEIMLARRAGGIIVPVRVGRVELSAELRYILGKHVRMISMSKEPSAEELDGVVNQILRQVRSSRYHCRDTADYRDKETIHLPSISCIDSMTFYGCDNLRCVYIPDSVVFIAPDAFDYHPGILVRCSADSYAARYCLRHHIAYEVTD